MTLVPPSRSPLSLLRRGVLGGAWRGQAGHEGVEAVPRRQESPWPSLGESPYTAGRELRIRREEKSGARRREKAASSPNTDSHVPQPARRCKGILRRPDLPLQKVRPALRPPKAGPPSRQVLLGGLPRKGQEVAALVEAKATPDDARPRGGPGRPASRSIPCRTPTGARHPSPRCAVSPRARRKPVRGRPLRQERAEAREPAPVPARVPRAQPPSRPRDRAPFQAQAPPRPPCP